MMLRGAAFIAALLLCAPLTATALSDSADDVNSPAHHHRGHHHHHRHGHHHQAGAKQALVAVPGAKSTAQADGTDQFAGNQLAKKVQKIDKEIAAEEQAEGDIKQGHLLVNGPLPADFSATFANAVATAIGCKPEDVIVLHSFRANNQPADVQDVVFQASPQVVSAVAEQAADPNSKLAMGSLHSFLVAKEPEDEKFQCQCRHGLPPPPPCAITCPPAQVITAPGPDDEPPAAPKGPYLDVDTEMPFGNLEPFGREDTAQELTEQSVKESDAMVDQLEKAEVAEEKRAVFRALTRLRGAAIASFDGIAHSQTGNIDEYAKTNKWRDAHPVHHLASEEADVYKWAFPDKSE